MKFKKLTLNSSRHPTVVVEGNPLKSTNLVFGVEEIKKHNQTRILSIVNVQDSNIKRDGKHQKIQDIL